VRAADLRLTRWRLHLPARRHGLGSSEADLACLTRAPRGGRLATGRAFPARRQPGFVRTLSGSHRFILGYLTEEVLARQPAAVQQFRWTPRSWRLSGDPATQSPADRQRDAAGAAAGGQPTIVPLTMRGAGIAITTFCRVVKANSRRSDAERLPSCSVAPATGTPAAMPVEAIGTPCSGDHGPWWNC
jgi:hypothetical protein